jgi:flagellar protein FlaI
LKEAFDDLIDDVGFKIDDKSYYKIWYYIIRDFLYYDKITPLMFDTMLEDISCNGVQKYIYIFHRKYTNLRTNIIFNDPDELDSFVVNLAQKCGKHISIAEPMIDATMPDGSRIQMTLGREVTDHGSTFTIRKFRDEPVTPIDLIAWKTFSSEQMAYLWLCIENKKSLIFAGGTASGKTTSMNAISLFIPRRSKIVTIEDTRELMLPHENWIPSVTRDAFHGEKGAVDMYDLLRAALRQRPEYIIVGEVRGKEALTLFQAMATGHTTYSTLHADSISGAIHRLENPPIGVPRPMLEALDIISIQGQTYVGDRRVRRNLEIAEIVGLDAHTKMLRTSTVFQWDSVKDEHSMVGTSRALEEIRRQRGWSVRELNEELERRKRVLEFMLSNGIRMFKDVSAVIHAYQVNPERAMKYLGVEEL